MLRPVTFSGLKTSLFYCWKLLEDLGWKYPLKSSGWSSDIKNQFPSWNCHLDPLKERVATFQTPSSYWRKRIRLSRDLHQAKQNAPGSAREWKRLNFNRSYTLPSVTMATCPKNLTKWGTLGTLTHKKKLIHIKSHSPSIPIPFSGGFFPDLSFGARALQLASAWIATGPNWAMAMAGWWDVGRWDGMGQNDQP